MAIFGHYQTDRELYRSGFTVLYSGRTSESSESNYAIKVFQPSSLLLETDQVKSESDLFLNSARVQQKTALSGAEFWAPIHQCDSIPDGAFYATDKYDRSLKQLIDTNISLTPQALLKIIESIALGLVELKKACNRPHGNLKDTNILIAGKGDISQTKIALSDPLPDEHIDKEVHWDSDLREIAEFIYQLVIHRPSPNVDGWQVPDSKEWTKLGKHAQELRNLCNQLLVAHMKPGTMTVEILIRELARLKKIKPVFSTRRLVIAAVCMVFAVITVICFRSIIFPAEAAKLEDWNRLLTEYEGWVNDLRGDLIGPSSNQRAQRWKNNPHLGAIIVENIINNNKASYPSKVAADNSYRAKDLRTKITTQEDMDKYDITLSKTNAAMKAVEIIKYFFVPESDPNSLRFYDPNLPQAKQEYQKWPLLIRTQQVSSVFNNRGWRRSAKYFEDLVNDIKPDQNIAENVDKILELQPILDDIKSHWTEIENNEKIIVNSGYPFLSRLSDYIKQEPILALEQAAKEDINNVGKTLSNELKNRAGLTEELAESINKNWQKLKENQEIIKDTGNPTLVRFPDYVQSQLGSVALDLLSEKLQETSSSAQKLADFVKNNWQKLKENQKQIIDAGDPILNKFPDYLNSKLDSAHSKIINEEADPDILLGELEKINNLADTLAKFDWQKVDKESFLLVHKNDSEKIITEKTFMERLNIIEDYYYLAPDPRVKLFELVERTKNNIEEAKGYNPQFADECVKNLEQVQPEIESMRKFRGIKKEQEEIIDKINNLQPVIVKINETAISLIETPKEWVQRMSEDSRIASSEALNNKWIELRDKVIKGPEIENIDENKALYQNLRKRLKDTKENLVKLDGEILRGLPAQIDTKLEEKSWNKQLKEVYDEERNKTIESILEKVPLRSEVPDINDPLLEEFRRNKFSEFEKRRNDFGVILEAFNKIEDGLDSCYLLSDKLPEIDQNMRSLWEKWRNSNTIREVKISEILAILTERLARLLEIEESNDRQKLSDIALGDESYTESVYAAWLKLGELLNPPWPTETEDFDIEKRIYEKLKGKFEEIGDEGRKGELLTILGKTTLERGIIYKKASIERFRKTIEQNHAKDKILVDITSFISTEINSDKELNELETIENLAKKMADFLSQEDWKTDKFRKDLFWAESDIFKSYSSVSRNNLETTVETWLKEVEDYKIVKDPRESYQWDEKINEIEQLVEGELRRKQAGASKQNLVSTITGISKLFENALGGRRTDPAEQSIEKLKQEYDRFTETVQEINAMLALPPIEKNRAGIDTNICNKLWENLLNHEATVRSIIKPEYCRHLELLEGKVQRLVFATTTQLSEDFEPVNITRLQAISKKEPLFGAFFKFVQSTTENLLGFSRVAGTLNKLPLPQLGELFNKTVEVTGWEQIRQAVKNNETEWLNFFYTTELNKAKNLGWPRYIVSKKDPTVILRFIPAGDDNPEPFYIATHEITNGQYRAFLEKNGARSRTNRPGWSWFVDQVNKDLIVSQSKDVPPCAIKWDGTQKVFTVAPEDADVPVTYVTYLGAQSYAESIGARLPTVSQHKYACKAGDNIITPWMNLSEISNYAHVRAGSWQKAASAYNSKVGTADEIPPPPVGAVKQQDFIPYQTVLDFNKEKFFPNDTDYNSAWPVAGANKPNEWGLYDMIGNVWEWCGNDNGDTQPVICGGSCLAPPEYIELESDSYYQYSFDKMASDVGFRVIVPAR